jgi:hypothetical protein
VTVTRLTKFSFHHLATEFVTGNFRQDVTSITVCRAACRVTKLPTRLVPSWGDPSFGADCLNSTASIELYQGCGNFWKTTLSYITLPPAAANNTCGATQQFTSLRPGGPWPSCSTCLLRRRAYGMSTKIKFRRSQLCTPLYRSSIPRVGQ